MRLEVNPKDLDLKMIFDAFGLSDVYQTVIDLFSIETLKIFYFDITGVKNQDTLIEA